MLQIGNRELADAKIPVWMSGPLDIEFIAPVKRELYILTLEFVHDGAVVDALDRYPPPVALIIKTRAFFLDCRDVNGPHAEKFLGQKKIGQRFLMQRINLHQDYIFGIARADDGPPQEFSIRRCLKAA